MDRREYMVINARDVSRTERVRLSALVTGNTVVHKPSERCPVTGRRRPRSGVGEERHIASFQPADVGEARRRERGSEQEQDHLQSSSLRKGRMVSFILTP